MQRTRMGKRRFNGRYALWRLSSVPTKNHAHASSSSCSAPPEDRSPDKSRFARFHNALRGSWPLTAPLHSTPEKHPDRGTGVELKGGGPVNGHPRDVMKIDDHYSVRNAMSGSTRDARAAGR